MSLFDDLFTIQQTANSALSSASATAATLAAQQAASNANNLAGGAYFNISQSGADGDPLSADYGSTGPTTGDLCIRGNVNEIGINAADGDGTYWAVSAAADIFTTNDQSLTLVLGSQGGSTSAPLIGYFSCDSGFTAGSYARIDNASVTLGSFTRSGSTFVYTPFTSGTWSGTPQSGNRVQIYNSGTTYNVLVNGLHVKTVTGSHTAGQFYWAISMDRLTTSAGWWSGTKTYDAFRVSGGSVADYVSPPYVGSGARIYRSSTTQVTPIYTTATQTLPASFFDTTDKNTADITVDLTNGKLTVAN